MLEVAVHGASKTLVTAVFLDSVCFLMWLASGCSSLNCVLHHGETHAFCVLGIHFVCFMEGPPKLGNGEKYFFPLT